MPCPKDVPPSPLFVSLGAAGVREEGHEIFIHGSGSGKKYNSKKVRPLRQFAL